MAWRWPGGAKSGASDEWTGFIDQGVTMEGTLQVKGTFRIDGNVKGNIISEQTVILGEGAKVEGQIEGNHVVIAGRFDGVIFAKGRVEIQPKGVVTGLHGDRPGWHFRWPLPYARLVRFRLGAGDNSDPRREQRLVI
jgi:cytoskeletal protein CcmA (bactofilin family)